jgi:hypothetical protein
MADVIPFPAPVPSDPPNAVLATVREYFDTGYLDIIDAELVPGDRFLAWLWLCGFKVVPLTDEDQ